VSLPRTANSTRPTVVTVAFWLWIASVVIALIAFATSVSALAESSSSLKGAAGAGFVAGSFAAPFIGAALRIVFAIFLLRGANWARIVLTILGALIVLSSLLSIANGNIFVILELIIVVVAVVLPWLPAAKPYFRRA
jgi:hypothetical protein